MLFSPPKGRLGWFVWVIVVPLVATTVWVIWLAVSTIWGAKSLSYEVTASTVTIVYGATGTTIEREDIVDITVIQRPTQGRRHFGTNMTGLKQGRWSFKETGAITLYATTIYPLTVITSHDQKWGISPVDPEAFVAAVQSGHEGLFDPIAVDRTGGVLLVSISTILMIGVTVGMIAAIYPMFGKIGYELTDNHVVIHGRRPIKIRYRDITDVRIEQPKGLPIKTIGINMPGLYWGSFIWRGVGRHVRLYATILRPMVFLTVGDDLYGISPKDHETFVKQLNDMLKSI